jgi:predicted transcriptional regulator
MRILGCRKCYFRMKPTIRVQDAECMKTDRYAFILVSDEKYWTKLSERSKTNKGIYAFVRKNQVGPKAAEKLFFYVKKPIMRVLGTADFIERLTGPAEELWAEHGGETCFQSLEEYFGFAQGRLEMTFVRFKNFMEIENPKPTESIRAVLGSLHGFRGKYVTLETANQLIT